MTEMDKLAAGLNEKGIPFERMNWMPFGGTGEKITCGDWDAICCRGSQGYSSGLLETMGLPLEDADDYGVAGYLRAEEILAIL